jgi:N-methylhydantoinase A
MQNILIPCEFGLDEVGDEDCTFLRKRFEEKHRQRYSFELPDSPLEIANIRVVGRGEIQRVSLQESEDGAGKDASGAVDHEVEVYFDSEWRETGVYGRNRLRPGHEIPGPAIVVQDDTTTVIEPGYRGAVDSYGNILIEEE